MGMGFSLDPNEHRAAAGVIEGYGAAQADHGSALAAGTSTPLSSSGTGISGAISMIAQGTVQKIVTDVTSSTQGFANDTATGLRIQANQAEQQESDLAGHITSAFEEGGQAVFADAGSPNALAFIGGGPVSAFADDFTGTLGSAAALPGVLGGVGGNFSSPFAGGIGRSAMMNTTVGDDPFSAENLGTGRASTIDTSAAAPFEAEGTARPAGPVSQSAATPFDEMHGTSPRLGTGGMRGGGSGGSMMDESGSRPGYLKSRDEESDGNAEAMRAASDKHKEKCGIAPIAFGSNQLVCAKCGSIINVGGFQSLTD